MTLKAHPRSPEALPYAVVKRAPAQQFLVLGSAYLGVDPAVAAVLKQYAKFNGMQPIHSGPVATREEVNMYRFRQHKVKTLEKIRAKEKFGLSVGDDETDDILAQAYEDLCSGVKFSSLPWDDYTEDELEQGDIRVLRTQLSLMVQDVRYRAEMDELVKAVQNRINVLVAFFPGIKFLYGTMDVLDPENPPSEMTGSANLGTHFRPSKYIGLTSMMANGPKITHWPITARTLKSLKKMKHSWILPHPIVQAESHARPGLNNADNFFTTGRLSFPDAITHTSEIHYASHLPGAVALTLDKDGTFFARNIIVEQTDDGHPFTLEDDRVFTDTGLALLSAEQIVVGITDTHCPHDHKGTKACFHAAGVELAPGHVVDCGDATDFESVSPFVLKTPGEQEGKRLGADIQSLVDHLDLVGSINPQATKVLVDSNHHEWVSKFVDKNPALKDMLHWRKLGERFEGWVTMIREAGDNVIHKIADMNFRHGDQESVEKAEEIFGKYVGGHYHRFRRLGHCLSVGPAAKLGPKYLQGNITAWQSQFFTVGSYQGKALNQAKTVLHVGKSSKTVLRNQIIEVTLLTA